MAENRYPQDEFDRLAAQRTVRGTHRRKESTLKWWIALAVILVLAPVAGWAIVQFSSSGGSPSKPTAAHPSSQQTSQVKTSKSEDPSKKPSQSPTASQSSQSPSTTPSSPTPQASLNRPVLVLNGAGIRGIAAEKQKALAAKGFTSVSVSDYNLRSPRVSTVFFPKESDRQTAVEVAKSLGISEQSVQLSPAATGGDRIVAVLKNDIRR